jgi:hypothetical protein
MKRIGKKGNFKKGFCVLLLASALFCSNLSVTANTAMERSTQDIQIDKSPYVPSESLGFVEGYNVLLDENFTDGNMPPTGDWGSWELDQTNQDETWCIDTSFPHSEPNCATVHRGGSTELQDEWLITPSLDFGGYTEIYLQLYWYTEYYVSAWMDYIDLNVSISTDGGSTWTLIWTEDDIVDVFPTWEWIDTNYPSGDPIDLSDYAGETDVKIGFQYYSNSLEEAEYQEFSIDDIIVYVPGEPFECSVGGPYEWWWPMQYEYTPPGVRFHGDISPPGRYKWLWDFGDGNTSIIPYVPIHFYNTVDTFTVSLTVIDDTSDPPRVAFNQTTVTLFLMKPPEIDITIQKPSIGIKAEINNPGERNASYVNWTMVVHWGPRQIFENRVANDTIERIAPGTSEEIRSRLYFFGFGRIHIVIAAEPENMPGVIKHFDAVKIGPLIFGAQ